MGDQSELLNILVCPVTRQKLRPASEDTLSRLNARIRDKALATVAGRAVSEPLGGALVREDGKLAYPVREGIPILIKDEAVSLD